jgi:hypothetical protein
LDETNLALVGAAKSTSDVTGVKLPQGGLGASINKTPKISRFTNPIFNDISLI